MIACLAFFICVNPTVVGDSPTSCRGLFMVTGINIISIISIEHQYSSNFCQQAEDYICSEVEKQDFENDEGLQWEC